MCTLAAFFLASVLASEERTIKDMSPVQQQRHTSPLLAAIDAWEALDLKKPRTTDDRIDDVATDPGPLGQQLDDSDSTTSTAARHVARAASPAASAAPKVFGINIYLVIIYLALLYLMYRTGSLF